MSVPISPRVPPSLSVYLSFYLSYLLLALSLLFPFRSCSSDSLFSSRFLCLSLSPSVSLSFCSLKISLFFFLYLSLFLSSIHFLLSTHYVGRERLLLSFCRCFCRLHGISLIYPVLVLPCWPHPLVIEKTYLSTFLLHLYFSLCVLNHLSWVNSSRSLLTSGCSTTLVHKP